MGNSQDQPEYTFVIQAIWKWCLMCVVPGWSLVMVERLQAASQGLACMSCLNRRQLVLQQEIQHPVASRTA